MSGTIVPIRGFGVFIGYFDTDSILFIFDDESDMGFSYDDSFVPMEVLMADC
jgi:hypothetical protein